LKSFIFGKPQNMEVKKKENFEENGRMIYCLPSQWAMLGTTDSINEN